MRIVNRRPVYSAVHLHEACGRERQRIVKIVCDQAAGRVPVLAGAAEANTRETIAACEIYAEYGARAVAIVLPFYYKLSPESVYAYFREIALHSPIDVTDLLHAQRAVKTEDEIERLHLANRVADFGLKRFHRATQPGVSEAELAAAVYTECLTRGTRVKKRSPCKKTHSILVLSAQHAAMACMKARVPACRPHDVATEELCRAGFAEDVVHLTGYGIGFRYHEPEPCLMPGNRQGLKTGHVCSVEPGLYNHDWGGIRLEDNVVVRRDGIEVLTYAPKRLT